MTTMGEKFGYTLTGPTRLGQLTHAQLRIYAEGIRRENERQEREQERAEAEQQSDGPLNRTRPKGTVRSSDQKMLDELNADIQQSQAS